MLARTTFWAAALVLATWLPASAQTAPSPRLNNVTIDGTITGGKVTATGSTTARSMAARAADVINVKDYGAVCDGTTNDAVAIQAAFTAAANAATGITLVFPTGKCLINSQISQSIGANHGIRVQGAGGQNGIYSANGSGVDITLTATTATFDIANMAFIRTAGGISGTGLAVTATVSGVLSYSHFDNLTFNGSPSRNTASWQVGLHLTSLGAPVIHGVISGQPDGTNSTTNIGIQLSGTDTSHFLIDTKISDTALQGGHASISVDGAVQGVFITNSEGIGSDYGIYAEDTTNFLNFQEALLVTNNHFNNLIAGIYIHRMPENQIIGNLFLHFNPLAGREWDAIKIEQAGQEVVSGNTIFGTGVNPEKAIKIFGNEQLNVVTGNNVMFISGLCVDAAGSFNTLVTGNSCQATTAPGIALGATSYAANNVINGVNVPIGAGSTNGAMRATSSENSATVTATGLTQGTAAAITANFTYVNAGQANGSGVILPLTTTLPAGSATYMDIQNLTGGFAVSLYPGVGESINGLSANTALSVPSGNFRRLFYPGTGTTWIIAGEPPNGLAAPLASPSFTGTAAVTNNQPNVTTFSVNNNDASGRSSLTALAETSKGAYLESASSTSGVTAWRSAGILTTDWQTLMLSAYQANAKIDFQTGGLAAASIHMRLDGAGHLSFLGTAPAVATGAGDCGTSPAIVGNDASGRITVGSAANGGKCTITFATAWTTNAPVCRAIDETTNNLIRPASASTTAVAFTGTLTAGDVLAYSCVGYQ